MKLTSVLLTFCLLQVAARTGAQVNYSAKQGDLKAAFAKLKEQTGMVFFYSPEEMAYAKPVTVEINNLSIDKALDKLLKDQPFLFTIEGNTVFIKLSQKPDSGHKEVFVEAIKATVDLHGVVKDENGKAIEGVVVSIKGGSKATLTNSTGDFLLKGVDANSTIVFSAVNLQTLELKVNGRIDFNITLKAKVSELADVTVGYSTGYQNVPKERATGSFEYIGRDKLDNVVSPDILSRIANHASGIFFTPSRTDELSTSNIFVRGLSTINSGTEPLIILDNFPYAGNIANINPNDVESITLLKDAAAASIWGAKSGNGVIVITTKKGKFNTPLQVTLNTNVTVTNKPNLNYDPQWLDSKNFIDVEKMLFANGFYDADLTASNFPVVSPVVQALADARSGRITQGQADAIINGYTTLDNRAQQKKYLYNRPVNQQYSLSFNGGSQNINYYVSAGFDNTLGTQKGNGFNRQTLHTLTNFTPLKNFQFSVGLDYNHTGSDAYGYFVGFGPGGGKSVYYPYAMLADAAGNHLTLPKDYAQSFKDTAGGGQLLDWNYRPLDEFNTGSYNNTQTNDVLANISVKYTFLKHFTISLLYQYEKMNTQNKVYYSVSSYYARNMINQYTQGYTGGKLSYPIPIGGILYSSFGDMTSHNFRPVLNFTKNWGGKHEIAAIAGAEINQVRKVSVNPNVAYGYNDDLLTYGNVNYAQGSYNYFDGIGYSSRVPSGQSYGDVINRFLSFYVNASYTYNGKYTLSASTKKDESNLFGVNANNRGVPLWSAGSKWKISEEPFYKASFLPQLALRVTYGYCGNVNNNISALPVISYGRNDYYTNLPIAGLGGPLNKDLRWEKDGQLNIGVDFGFKSNILSGSVEWYQKNAVDLLQSAPIDPTTGNYDATRNVANLKTNGLDLTLNGRIIQNTFKWNAQLIGNYVTSKITKYLSTYIDYSQLAQSTGLYITPMEGIDPYIMYAYKFAGLDPTNGDPQGIVNKQVSKDYGTIFFPDSLNQLTKMGTGRAPFYGSLSNTFSYKGFSLSVMLAGRFGYYFRKTTINYSDFFNSWTGHQDFLKRWQQPGDEKKTTVPSMVYPADYFRDAFYQYATPNVVKGDNIRLQYVTLAYDFKPIKMGSYTLKNLNVYLNANNLGILWRANKDNLDPDFPTGYPNPFSFSLGLRSSF